MKLQCQVDVVNRSHSNLNIRTGGKYLKSTLALGKEPKSETEYFILHFSTVNRSGKKYRVKNIKQVFIKCINDGKTTLRFDDPPHDLCIKSEAIQLKCFMKLLKSCLSGDAKALQLASLSSLSVTTKDNAPTKLVIHDRSEFPNKGLPRTLETLCISGLDLFNFRREILLLKRLTILDLSNNSIEAIPAEFGYLPSLREFYFAENQLGKRPSVDWRWLLGPQVSKTLKLLDLSGNGLVFLPKDIWKLQNLVTLKIVKNKLIRLPTSLGRISTLRYLSVSENSLQYLPCSLMQCKLEHIDLSANNFHNNELQSNPDSVTLWDFYCGSLVSLASKVVLKRKIFYAPNIIPKTLVDTLDNANMCICGAPVVNNTVNIFKEYDLKDFFRIVLFDSNLSSSVHFECYFCSPKCFRDTLIR